METNKILWAQLRVTRLEHDQYGASWAFGFTYRNGYPRISIYRVIAGTSTVAITLPMRSTELTYVALCIEDVADGVQPETSIDFLNNVYVNGVRSEKVETNGTMRIFRENNKVVIETKFLHADTDTRIDTLGIPAKENAISFRFPIANDIYFGGIDPVRYAKAYAKQLIGLNASYSATLADRESSSR